MHIGVIGVGRIGAFHARVLGQHPDVKQLSIADVDTGRCTAIARETGGTPVGVDRLLDAVDAVVIATDTAGHGELIERAVLAGRPIFCEKPIALDLASTRSVVELVRQSRATVQIGFQRRFDAGYERARTAVADGTIGRLYIVRTASHDAMPPHESYIPTSGGMFRDLSIHDFDIIRHVTGQDIIEVYADGSVLADEMFSRYDDVDVAVTVLRLSGGALGIVSGARHDPRGYDIRMELFGSGDSVAVGTGERMPLRSLEGDGFTSPDPWCSFIDRFGAAYRAEMHAFVDVVAGRRQNPCPPVEALIAMQVAVACDQSRQERRPVRVAEVNT